MFSFKPSFITEIHNLPTLSLNLQNACEEWKHMYYYSECVLHLPSKSDSDNTKEIVLMRFYILYLKALLWEELK